MKGKNNYTKFVGMLVASFIAMYIAMYLNTYAIDHVYFSLTRFYMSCLGIAAMAIIMFVAMRAMYQNKTKNIAIVLGCIALFATALSLVRVQAPIVGDVLWLRAMIPHHSIAILTSERADIQDPAVKKLANAIIEAQKKEIEEMKAMIERLEDN
jgi:peptidoglycan/LPS O-acetylase OafA/YrhL